jgi:5-methylcytosine-specific restriction endonuclease McrA
MLAKFKKIKDKQLLSDYAEANTFCEHCKHYNNRLNAYYLELHHILSGTYRTDELWNIIILCRKCHVLSTEHIAGIDAYERNYENLMVKLAKGEIDEQKLNYIFRLKKQYLNYIID